MSPRPGRGARVGRRRLAALALALGAAAGPAPGQEPAPPPAPPPAGGEAPRPDGDDPAVDVAALVERLRSDDPGERAAARERLAALPPAGQEALRALAAHGDPDVRFQVLELLGARDARVELALRDIVEKRAAFSGTYAAAREARDALLAQAGEAEVRGALARVARVKAGRSALSARWVSTALDLLAELLAASTPGPVDAAALGALLEADLGPAVADLTGCFAALPRELALTTLRAACGQGSPAGRARAAWVLGELAGPADAAAAARALAPLLAHPDAGVRLTAVRALGTLPLPDDAEALVAAGALARDPDLAVAEEALRLGGERRLAIAREAAERVAADAQAPPPLRRQAVRALGLLGQPGAAGLLRQLAMNPAERELQVLAAWALGAVRAPDAAALLRALTAEPDLAPDDRLYEGLARLGGEAGHAALQALLAPAPRGGDPAGVAPIRRARALAALGGVADPPEALIDLLVGLARANVDPRAWDPDGLGEAEVAVRALGRLADGGSEPAREALARLARLGLRSGVADALLEVVARVGPPRDPALRAELVQALTLQTSGGRPAAAQALARVDRDRAREVISRLVGGRFGVAVDGPGLELLHVLARCGDPGPVRARVVPAAREKLRDERNQQNPTTRLNDQNGLGIELLYAGEWDEAILEFRRMLWCEPRNQVASYNVACGHALAGRVEEALRALRRSLRDGYGDPDHMAADSDLDALRPDPRFQRLMARLRLDEETDVVVADDGWPATD